MSIKYAVLGLIAEEPRHGYAVRAVFEERLGDFWELNYTGRSIRCSRPSSRKV